MYNNYYQPKYNNQQQTAGYQPYQSYQPYQPLYNQVIPSQPVQDNRANNLRWVTYKENNNYAQQNGLWKTVTFNKKPVKCIETGRVFESAIGAARWIHIQIPTSKVETIMKNIKACCYGKQASAYKYHWKHLQ